MKGNIGEWSELYTFFKLIADGKLYAADSKINKIEDIYYDILKIIRKEANEKYEYVRNGMIRVINQASEQEIVSVNTQEFLDNSEIILNKISGPQTEASFSIDEINSFCKKIKCNTLKAKSSDKSDITLLIHDSKTASNQELGFSIKSQIGGASTLLNASKATNFIFKLVGNKLTPEQINAFNQYKLFKDKFNYLDSLGINLKFDSVQNEAFGFNLSLIDTSLPVIIADLIQAYYKKDASTILELTNIISDKNIFQISESNVHTFYSYKIKEFLTAVALGMKPASKWLGLYEATGGYIVVKEDGEILCYHIYNRNEFREYLFNNTKFDTPSQSKHDFGKIEEISGEQFLKLNFQIRFIK